LDVEVIRPEMTETTALGAAFAAGLSVGFWKNTAELMKYWKINKTFKPKIDTFKREELNRNWQKAIEKSKDWETL
jgi:glycerol kinase